MVQRVVLRRRHAYATKSNKTKVVKTPGGKLVVQYRKKNGSGINCQGCSRSLPGIPHLRPKQYSRISKRQKHVNRVYGGNQCASCVRERIVRAFMIEEQQNVKRVWKEKKA
eukprot:CAMPEP_0201513516 /NCGR_PEP_ID=MMETSP0161_2-20130828/5550_1 /ASSEMBLY_ACC=CAM_ASM_000251 /TAXON_ID=180227 /ORGANISM="Neoparamoeba aestuarina, Strain SoJaBio B1-5/56/2" /LENGTH=110 /DNA_ID=CAMNT_0047909761 /DNA_START=49 /DNA_END=381 /DNA_ORIENTATION=+